MRENTSKVCLFGGALMAAGLAGNAEAAWVGGAGSYAFANSDFVLGAGDLLAQDGSLTASRTFTPTEYRGEIDWDGIGGPASAGILSYATNSFAEDTSVLVAWDVTGFTAFDATSFISVLDSVDALVFRRYFGGDANTDNEPIAPFFGSNTLPLTAGDYTFSFTINGSIDPAADGPQFVSFSIPDPAAVPVPATAGLVLAGLLGAAFIRRRRD